MEFETPMDFLSNCWLPAVYAKPPFFYAFGNTQMRDFFEDLQVRDDVDLLFFGVGDIRNVLMTIAGFDLRPASAGRPTTVAFHLNDVDTEVIARDIVLLEIVNIIDADDTSDVRFLWEVWYNMTLSKKDYTRLMIIIEKISTDGYALSEMRKYGNEVTREKVQRTFRCWLKGKPPDVDAVKESRRRSIKSRAFYDIDSLTASESSVLTHLLQFCKDYNDPLLEERFRSQFINELIQFEQSGCARDPKDVAGAEIEVFINPTLMRPDTEDWHVFYNCNPFRSYLPMEKKLMEDAGTLYAACVYRLQQILLHKAAAMKSIRITAYFWSGCALTFCQQNYGIKTFDLIYTNNVVDYAGLLNIVVACVPLLKDLTSVLATETFHSLEVGFIDKYLQRKFPCGPLLLPTLYGVRLTEDYYTESAAGNLNRWCKRLHFSSPNAELFHWTKCLPEQNVLIDLLGSRHVQLELESLVTRSCPPAVELLFDEHLETSQTTALTLTFALQRLKRLVVGGMSELLRFVDNIFQTSERTCTHRATWDALCWAFGLRCLPDDELLLVKISYKGRRFYRPNPKEPGFAAWTKLLIASRSEVKFASTSEEQQHKELLENEIPKEVLSLYKFDASDNSFIFCMLKSKFENLPSDAILLIHAQFKLQTTAIVNLKSSGVIVRNFKNLHPNASETVEQRQLLQRFSCQEFVDRYEFRVENIPNGAQRMTVTPEFLPVDGPAKNELRLTVGFGLEGQCVRMTCRFLCFLQLSASKFRIFNKNGFIEAVVAKEVDFYNTGYTILPHRMIDESSELREFADRSDVLHYLWSSNAMGLFHHTEEDEWLQELLNCIFFQSASKSSERKKTIYLFKSVDHERKLEVQVKGYFLYKGIPLARVAFVDTEKMQGLFKESELDPGKFMLHKTSYVCENDEHTARISCTNTQFCLLQKLLFANSCECVREDIFLIWKTAVVKPFFS